MSRTRYATCPISSSPSSRSPSKMPFFALPKPSISFISSAEAPLFSASSTLRKNSFFMSRVGTTFFKDSIVSPSCRPAHMSLKRSLAELSRVSAKRVPICTPSAPSAKAASMPAPVPIPPAAIKGRSMCCLTWGTSTIVVVSSFPLCPPASKPSATTASTPAS